MSQNSRHWCDYIGLTDLQIRALAIVPQVPQTLHAGTGGIFTSTDAGKQWPAGIASLVIDPTNPQILYVGTDQGVFKSMNAGK
jgi:hypothetical protein